MNLDCGRYTAVILLLSSAAAWPAADEIDEIVVRADLRERSIAELPVSVTALDGDDIRALSLQHFEELTAVVPNLNWSGDGNRARYLQIRGVGELEQYEGAPDPSVGFLIDDIDFSGIGTIGTLFDIERVEVLRGPQGSRYGANALAGLVYLQSRRPAAERNGLVQLMAGGDGLMAGGVAFGGALDRQGRALYRLSAQQHHSDGFRHNSYLGRDNTNGRDETTLRARLSIEPVNDLRAEVAALYVDIDDGYDAFALDNSYTVLSDKPGRDAQRSTGASARIEWGALDGLLVTSVSSFASSHMRFGFDADWGNDDSWAPVLYDYLSRNDRQRRTLSQELRIAGDDDRTIDWLLGAYAMRLDEDLESVNEGTYYDPYYDYADGVDERLDSDYTATSTALFGQLEFDTGLRSRLSLGLRVEHRGADYADSTGLREDVGETMTGGEVAWSLDIGDLTTAYVSLSRGYKAGGFNLGIVPAGRRQFDAEYLWNAEAGLRGRWFQDRAEWTLTLFRNRRDAQQVRTSFQLDPGDPASFAFFTDNAARGTSNGLEAGLRWFAGEAWELYANLGLLDARFDAFVTPELDLSGRDQAHAPHYTFAAGASFQHPSGWFARVDVSGKDRFYFDVSHDQRSEPYLLAGVRAGYQGERWLASVWARNLFDEYYAVRGFYFGNEPPDFPPTLYTRAGDPRQAGITIERRF